MMWVFTSSQPPQGLLTDTQHPRQVNVSPEPDRGKKLVLRKIWNSAEVQNRLKQNGATTYDWLYDNGWLAW